MTCIDPVEVFLGRWLGRPGGAERANAQMFLSELCTVLEVEPPRPAARGGPGDYVFERPVRQRPSFGQEVCGRMDLYKRDCFVLESKQSHQGDEAEPARSDACRGHRLSGGGWDRLMITARAQAEGYVDRLPADHPAPPFMIVCDIGHVFEVFADFTGTGRGYSFFPDRRDYRIFLTDLRRPEIRERLRAIWTDPYSLDPSRRREKVTQEIASDMAAISRRLEETAPRGEGVERHSQEVARFLMRCIFCMFAASVDLLPRTAFLEMLDDCIAHPPRFVRFMRELWRMMNDPEPSGRYMSALDAVVPFTGGDLFSDAHVFALDAEAIGSLRRAAARAWSDVEPSIFGAIFEQALAPAERRRMGVHFTPAGHVRRLVRMTLGEPLRHDWLKTTAAVERLRDLGQIERARQRVRSFHQRLRSIRVLDPACGSGNFLYIALETVKGLEAEVMETLSQLGEPELLAFEMVDPGQFYGLEINPRAVVLAELVLWIGYLQLHYKGQVGHPSEPILHAYGTIRRADAVLEWDGAPEPHVTASGDSYPSPRQPDWPEVDFIVGNPPFLGGKDLRTRLGDAYAEALWSAHPEMNRSADLVMY